MYDVSVFPFSSLLFFCLFACEVKEQHRHRGGRDRRSVGRGEAGHRVGKKPPRQRRREGQGWDGLGRLNAAIGNKGTQTVNQYFCFLCLTAACYDVIYMSRAYHLIDNMVDAPCVGDNGVFTVHTMVGCCVSLGWG